MPTIAQAWLRGAKCTRSSECTRKCIELAHTGLVAQFSAEQLKCHTPSLALIIDV